MLFVKALLYWIGEYQYVCFGPENATLRLICSYFVHRGGGGGVGERGQYLRMLTDARVSSDIFGKGMPHSLLMHVYRLIDCNGYIKNHT